MDTGWPTPFNLMNGISLAIISFVGLESISHAAEETHRPASIIPRTSIALILTILIFALAYSNLALGMTPWHPLAPDAHGVVQPFYQFLGTAENSDKAVAIIAQNIPYFGLVAGLYVPILGSILLLISSNSGVFGASRIAYSMSQFRLLPSIFEKIDKKYRTPVVATVVFSLVAAKAKFESVIKLDPKNATAIGYLNAIAAKEAQANSGSQEKQLAKLIMPKVDFKEASLKATLDFLKQSVTKLSDGKQAVNFVVQLPETQANAPVTLSLTYVPFTEVLKYLGSLAGVSFTYDRYAITVRPAGPTAQATTAPAPGQ